MRRVWWWVAREGEEKGHGRLERKLGFMAVGRTVGDNVGQWRGAFYLVPDEGSLVIVELLEG